MLLHSLYINLAAVYTYSNGLLRSRRDKGRRRIEQYYIIYPASESLYIPFASNRAQVGTVTRPMGRPRWRL